MAAHPLTGGYAALPMYDWAELAPATDRLWDTLRDALRAAGVAAPDALRRDADLMAGWTDPGLVLGQTCGLPFVRELAGRVALVGVPDYGVPGCPPGWYRSAVVVRADDRRETLAAFRGARLAINGRDSQSGWGAILHHVAPMAEAGRFFGAVTVGGGHRQSIEAVAAVAADLAAIDFVSWRFGQRFLPAAARLRVLMLTDPTPGLPYIAARGTDAARHFRALAAGIAGLAPDVARTLGLEGLVALAAADYDLIARRMAAAEAGLAAQAAITVQGAS